MYLPQIRGATIGGHRDLFKELTVHRVLHTERTEEGPGFGSFPVPKSLFLVAIFP